MKSPAPALAILILALCSTPLFTGGQGIGLFRQDPAAAATRKAKRYNLVAVKDAVPGAFSGEYDEEEIRLVLIKFLSEVAN